MAAHVETSGRSPLAGHHDGDVPAAVAARHRRATVLVPRWSSAPPVRHRRRTAPAMRGSRRRRPGPRAASGPSRAGGSGRADRRGGRRPRRSPSRRRGRRSRCRRAAPPRWRRTGRRRRDCTPRWRRASDGRAPWPPAGPARRSRCRACRGRRRAAPAPARPVPRTTRHRADSAPVGLSDAAATNRSFSCCHVPQTVPAPTRVTAQARVAGDRTASGPTDQQEPAEAAAHGRGQRVDDLGRPTGARQRVVPPGSGVLDQQEGPGHRCGADRRVTAVAGRVGAAERRRAHPVTAKPVSSSFRVSSAPSSPVVRARPATRSGTSPARRRR